MTVLNWPDDFTWPYAGVQNPPKNFMRDMVRVQDQVFWLLNAIEKLNAAAASDTSAQKYATDAADGAVTTSESYTDTSTGVLKKRLADLEAEIAQLEKGIAVTRDPTNGCNEYIYNALHHMYDLMRPHSLTWAELAATGLTWDELATKGKSYWEMEANAAIILNNDDTERYRTSDYDAATPAYIPSLFETGTDWNDLKTHGFLYIRNN